MNKLSDKYCEPCLQLGIRKKVRTLCDECRELLCQECSDAHLRFKVSKNHNLLDLDPPTDDTRSASEDELASDFLDHVTVSDTTVLYRAQVAVEGGSRIVKQGSTNPKADKITNKDVDISKLRPQRISEFSVKRPDETENVVVRGIITLGDKVIIVDRGNKKLKLFDHSGGYLSATDVKYYTPGITRVNEDRVATYVTGNKVFLWTLRGDTIIREDVTYDVDLWANGIQYNGTYYCVLHRDGNAVTILDRQGRRVRKIVMKEAFGKEIEFGMDIHMDSDTHNMYIPCSGVNKGVLCMSVEGKALWFTPLADAGTLQLTEMHGVLCIADSKSDKKCLYLMSKTGQYMGKLLDKEELDGQPYYIYYDEQRQRLYVSYFLTTEKRDIISVYAMV